MKPLEGIKVVDFTQAHAGSLATMILADFGAEVIKIERAGVGDMARYWVPMKDGNSAYYTYLNRGKKSIGLNASTDEGREIIFKLLEDADILCENFKYGSMERMGLSYEEVKKVNPNIIYASLNGFGQTGPMKNVIGLDLQLQAMSGFMDRTGFPDGPPTKAGPAMGDQLSGTYMAAAINLALIHKKKTGEGQRIDISILDSLFSILEAAPMTYCLKGDVPMRVGNSYPSISPYDTLKTKDGYVSVGISTDRQWEKFCDALGMDDLKADERYKTNESRGIYYESGLKDALEAVTSKMSKFEIERILREARLACGAVYTVSEAMESDQIKARNMLVTVEDKALGEVTIPGTVIKMSETPGGFDEGAPMLGEHTEHYLKNLGYTDEQVKALIEDKIIEIA
ncbi:CaiB/BaiF CoA transferase family protein [Anaerotignum sp.]|uniref:CaiB/BaiF CoA transferase family protein n=1 Tax=Anaerotignum sp. TaxID=2039241 RepID=UPI0028B08864|nr:CaiB/BaiF CoA-transferase family protein [Anaerotignum sp.]